MQTLEIEEEALVPPLRRRPLTAMEEEWKRKKDTNNQDAARIKWNRVTFFIIALLAMVVVAVVLSTTLKKHHAKPASEDKYVAALRKALLFYDGQMSGQLQPEHRIPWRGNSGMKDGANIVDVPGGLVGGYYDGGDNIKYTFPMAYSMTMLSWSVIEYSHKYKAIGEYDHVREIIKWGTDYLLRSFVSSGPTITHIYCQVGLARKGSSTPDDGNCWQRPEDMEYERAALGVVSGPDLAGEMTAALASASIVFQDDASYSKKLMRGAKKLWEFARDPEKRMLYSQLHPDTALVYNSTGYYDEYFWAATWMYCATGDYGYLSLTTTGNDLAKKAHAFSELADLRILSWDNKLPGAELLLTRIRMMLSPGYPYEELLRRYHDHTSINMCSYLRRFSFFNWTRGGMIELNTHGRPQPLQYVASAAFISSLYAGYMEASDTPGWYCGPTFISSAELRTFASSQVDYILGANPMNMSYLVGFGSRFPQHVYHRGASIPNDGTRYSCTDGWKWHDSPHQNPNNITGAMVGGPDKNDKFIDARNPLTQPTIAANAGLVAALASLASSGGIGIDENTIFTAIPPEFPDSPPPPPPWEPLP